MKLFFVKEDSLYKIFKTLEKIPRKKQVQIFIDAEHSLFENEWRWKQIKEILNKKELNTIFVTKSEHVKVFFEDIWCSVEYQWEKRIKKAFDLLYLFLFNIKKFHLHTFNQKDAKKKTMFYLVYIFEVCVVIGVLFLLYLLILPTTTITITQSQETDTIIYNFRYYPHNEQTYPKNSRYISIPYYTGHLDYQYNLSIHTHNLRHIEHPSKWKAKIINKIPHPFNFVKNTRFVTNDGLMFKTPIPIHIPAAYNNTPWEVTIPLVAMEKDNEGIIMGSRGNIKAHTQLYVKNLKQSLLLKQMVAISMEDFSNWANNETWVIHQEDISILSWEMHNYIKKNKLLLAKNNFDLEDWILLNFDKTTQYKITGIRIHTPLGEKSDKVSGTISARLYFIYVRWEDILTAFQTFIQQRPMKTSRVLNLDKNSFFIFTDDIKKDTRRKYWSEVSKKSIIDSQWIDTMMTYIIPTKINIIKWYDFNKDINGIVPAIKTNIIGIDKNQARNSILKYPEVSSVAITINPPWYSIIPTIKSRIKIETVY